MRLHQFLDRIRLQTFAFFSAAILFKFIVNPTSLFGIEQKSFLGKYQCVDTTGEVRWAFAPPGPKEFMLSFEEVSSTEMPSRAQLKIWDAGVPVFPIYFPGSFRPWEHGGNVRRTGDFEELLVFLEGNSEIQFWVGYTVMPRISPTDSNRTVSRVLYQLSLSPFIREPLFTTLSLAICNEIRTLEDQRLLEPRRDTAAPAAPPHELPLIQSHNSDYPPEDAIRHLSVEEEVSLETHLREGKKGKNSRVKKVKRKASRKSARVADVSDESNENSHELPVIQSHFPDYPSEDEFNSLTAREKVKALTKIIVEWSNSRHPCQICGKLMVPGSLLKHIRTIHPTHHMVCPISSCNQELNGYSEWAVHINEVHGGRKFKCLFRGCPSLFYSPNDMVRGHLNSHYNIEKKQKKIRAIEKESCNSTGIVEASEPDQEGHEESPVNGFPVINSYFPQYPREKEFSALTQKGKIEHIKKIVEEWSNSHHSCQICGQAMKPAALMSHIRASHPSHPMRCPISRCNSILDNYFDWDDHIVEVHEGQKFNCLFRTCSTIFRWPKGVIRHLKSAHETEESIDETEESIDETEESMHETEARKRKRSSQGKKSTQVAKKAKSTDLDQISGQEVLSDREELQVYGSDFNSNNNLAAPVPIPVPQDEFDLETFISEHYQPLNYP